MGFSFSTLELAHQATNSRDENVLLEWILTHENEIYRNDETHLANPIIQKVTELGFPKSSAELAQRKTNSNDVQTLIEWILNHNSSEEYRSTSIPSTTNQLRITTKKQEENKKTDNTLLNDLLKLGFDTNVIENCFIDLNINTTKKFNLKTKRIECIDWLINNSQKKALSKAKEISRSRKQLRVPAPIKLNNYQNTNSHSMTPQMKTNNFLKQVHLSSRHQTTDNDEQQPSLTPEEVLMADIHENLKRQSWTIYNLDQLNLIQKHIKVVAKIIDEDHHNIQRYSDNEGEEKTQRSRTTTTAKPSKNHQTKKIFTLADLTVEDRTEYRSNGLNVLAKPPPRIPVPG
jgi:hypothetical protein